MTKVTVEAPAGNVTGLRSGDVVEYFRGIRYGIFEERFDPASIYEYPQPREVDATSYGDWCFQSSRPMLPDPTLVYAEDCLFLNLWRPAEPDVATPLPVMFYIHGGGFTQGGGADPLFEGSKLAVAENVIVVTVNYRLGPLGFLVLDDGGTGGMNGLADIILALRWTRENVRSFGGDPLRITVFGESAGGCATCTLALSSASAGLFRNAIVESGPCLGPWAPESVEAGLRERDALMLKYNVTSIAELRNVDAQNLSNWPLPTGGYFYDNVVMSRSTESVLREDGFHVATIALGGNSFDGTSELLPFFPKPNATEAEFAAAMALRFGAKDIDRLIAYYDPFTNFSGSPSAAFVEADSDHTNACPNLKMSRLAASGTQKGGHTFLYNFAHLQRNCDLALSLGDVPAGMSSWASHASEIVFVWNNTVFKSPLTGETISCDFTAAEDQLSRKMMSLWAAIARSDAPHVDAWPAFESEAERTLRFSVPSSELILGFKSGVCAFWDSLGGDRGE
eukprot:g1791.t1